MDEQELIAQVAKLKSDASSTRSVLEHNFEEYWNMYNGVSNLSDTQPWRSKLYMKETFKAIDTIHPIFLDMLFMQGDPFRIKGVDGAIDEMQAKVLERLIKVYTEKMDMYNTVDDFVKDMLVYGTAFAKLYWDVKIIEYEADETYEEDKEYNIAGLKIKRKEKKKRKVTKRKYAKDSPRLERVDWKDIFVGSRATNLQEFPVIHRTWKTYSQIVTANANYKEATGENLYKNLDKVALHLKNGTNKSGDQQDQITSRENEQMGISETGAEDMSTLEINAEGEIEILEYWTADNTRVYTIAGGQVVIRDAENPFDHHMKPFLYANYIRRPGKIYGIGACELCKHGQALLNTAVNQAMDSNNLVNNVMLLADREANIDFDQVKAKPGGVIFVDKEPQERLLDKVAQLKFSRVDTNNEISLAIREIQEVTGASRIAQGTYESGSIRNTSQTRLMMGASNKRFTGKVLTYEEMFLKPFVRMLYGLIQQYVEEETVINILGEFDDVKYVKVRKLDICRDLDFIPVGSRQLIEMEQMVHQMNNFLAVAAGIPYAPALVNFRYLLKKIWDNISPDHDGDKVILSDKEAKRAFSEMQALAQMGGATKIMEQGSGKEAGLGGMNGSQPNMAGGVQ